MRRPTPSPLLSRWALDPATVFLNHGSFGACPRVVLAAQAALRTELEANPVELLGRGLDVRMAAVRERLGAFLGAAADDLALVPNATHAIATVLRSLPLGPGDEVVVTDHEYRAAVNAVVAATDAAGARVVTAAIPLPLGEDGPELIEAALLGALSERTRLVVISHVTSPTALRLPLERIVPALERSGVPVLVDGAHGPGMLPLALDALGASWYAGNLHKWVCAPKGAGFLHVRRDRQEGIRPLAISHGASDRRPGRSAFRKEFDWTGTADPTPWLAVPAALDAIAALEPGGWPAVMERNAALARRGRATVLTALGSAFGAEWGRPLSPDGMLGSMAAVAVPEPPVDGRGRGGGPATHGEDPLAARLRERHAIEIPVFRWPPEPDGPLAATGLGPYRIVRLSAHLHDHEDQYRYLGEALVAELAADGVAPGAAPGA